MFNTYILYVTYMYIIWFIADLYIFWVINCNWCLISPHFAYIRYFELNHHKSLAIESVVESR